MRINFHILDKFLSIKLISSQILFLAASIVANWRVDFSYCVTITNLKYGEFNYINFQILRQIFIN